MTIGSSPIIRKSLPLSSRDVSDLSRLRESDTYHAAIQELTSFTVTDQTSEASFLHAVLEAGILAIEQKAQEAGYAQMAQDIDVAARKAFARRRTPTWATE